MNATRFTPEFTLGGGRESGSEVLGFDLKGEAMIGEVINGVLLCYRSLKLWITIQFCQTNYIKDL